MFECNYKFELADNIKCAKYVYNSQKRKKDKVIAIMLPILLLAMIAMLIVDIVNKKNLVWDIVLLAMLIILQVMYFVMPVMVVKQTKKAYKSQDLDSMDAIKVNINDNSCSLAFVKGEQEHGKKVLSLKSLTSYIEDNENIVLVFNNVEYVLIKKNALKGDLNKLKSLLQKAMAKSQRGK